MVRVTAAGLDRVGVVGYGLMGAGIAELCAGAGYDVTVAVSRPESLDRGRDKLRKRLDGAVAKGKLTADGRDAILDRIRFTTELSGLGDRQFVIEAVPEHEATKLQVFEQLDKAVADPDAILASTTSAVPIMRLGRATNRPGRVVGVHFFNPVPVMPLVEVVPSLATSADTVARTESLVVDGLGKQVIRAPDRAGFVVNALLVPYLLAAVRMLEAGLATATDIDKGMTLGCAHPMGPLALIDLIGLDTIRSVGLALYEEHREPLYAPPPLLSRMVEGGLLGRKTGRGFFAYP